MLDRLTASILKYWFSFIALLPRLVLAVAIVVAGVFIAGWISGVFKKRIASKSHDPLMGKFLGKTIRIILIIIVGMIGLNAAGLSGIAGGILATAGASAVVVGFAFKDIAENFIAGIILAFNRPFHVDETIQIDNTFGKVKDMAFRYTKILTFDGRDIYIPNSDVLKKPVINFTGNGFYRLDFIVGIAYEAKISEAMDIIQKCLDEAEGVIHDADHINFVAEDKLSASTVDLKVFFWVSTEDYRRGALVTRGRLIRTVKEAMDAAGIYLPCDVSELKAYEPAGDLLVKYSASPKESSEAKPEKEQYKSPKYFY